MKKLIFLSFLVILVSSCDSHDDRTKFVGDYVLTKTCVLNLKYGAGENELTDTIEMDLSIDIDEENPNMVLFYGGYYYKRYNVIGDAIFIDGTRYILRGFDVREEQCCAYKTDKNTIKWFAKATAYPVNSYNNHCGYEGYVYYVAKKKHK